MHIYIHVNTTTVEICKFYLLRSSERSVSHGFPHSQHTAATGTSEILIVSEIHARVGPVLPSKPDHHTKFLQSPVPEQSAEMHAGQLLRALFPVLMHCGGPLTLGGLELSFLVSSHSLYACVL